MEKTAMKSENGVCCLTPSVKVNVSFTETFFSVVKLVSDFRVGRISFPLHPFYGHFSLTVNLFRSEVVIVATTHVSLGGHVLHGGPHV